MTEYTLSTEGAAAALASADLLPVTQGGVLKKATPAQIATYVRSTLGESLEANTAITTVGAGTLTAAALVSGVITRTGPTSAYTDTTDTAALIIAAAPNAIVGQSWEVTIKNTVAFPATLAGGTSVTLSGQTIIPPNSAGRFLVSIATSSTVTMLGLAIVPLTTSPLIIATALTTVGAGTITAAGIGGSITTRGGAQSGAAFTDTTDTAANIIAALPNANIGQSYEWLYINNTNATATLAGGTGVTVSVATLVPANSWAVYLVTYTAAATVTIVGVMAGQIAPIPPGQWATAALAAGTLAAGQITGAGFTTLTNTGATPGTQTTRTAAQMLADIPGAGVGYSYTLRIVNTGAGTLTLAGGTGVTVAGTATVATNVFRDYNVTFASATTATIQSIGAGTSP